MTEPPDLEGRIDRAIADLALLISSSRNQLRTLLYAINGLSEALDTLLADAERHVEEGER